MTDWTGMATIESDAQVAARGPAHLRSEIDRHGMRSWSGWMDADGFTTLMPGGPFRLALINGRVGQVLVQNMLLSARGRRQRLVLLGTGPFPS